MKRSSGVTEETFRLVATDLEAMAKKPKTIPLKETIHRLSGRIREALAQGYTYADISEVLQRREIKIAPGTIKQYLLELQTGEEQEGHKGALAVGLSESSGAGTEQTPNNTENDDQGSFESPPIEVAPPPPAIATIETTEVKSPHSPQQLEGRVATQSVVIPSGRMRRLNPTTSTAQAHISSPT